MRKVWAVARNTIAQALRMKVALSVVVMLVILLPLMSMIMVGDGTLKGKLQTFISYGLGLTSALLCLLTIMISAYTLTSDLKDRHIYLVATKPIRRFQILCGKFLGIVVLDVFLLALFSGIIYGLTVTMPGLSKAGPDEIGQAEREFFSARISLSDPVDEDRIKQLAAEAYEKLQTDNQIPEKMSARDVFRELRGREMFKARAVQTGGEKVWEFENVHLDDDVKSIFIRYKLAITSGPPDVQIHSTWLVGDYRQVQANMPVLQSPIRGIDRSDAVRTFYEFEVDRDVIANDGYFAVVFRNLPVNETTVIPEEVQVLLQAGSFAGNYLRAILLIFIRLIFLAGLGVSISTWLSFPVAILIGLVVLSTGMVNGFIYESLDYLGSTASLIYAFTVRPVLWFLPQFDGDFNATKYMVSGRLLGGLFLARAVLVTVFIKTFILLLFGMLVFSKRELARTIV